MLLLLELHKRHEHDHESHERAHHRQTNAADASTPAANVKHATYIKINKLPRTRTRNKRRLVSTGMQY